MKKALVHVLCLLMVTGLSVRAEDGGTVSPFYFGAGGRDLALGGACMAESDFATAPFWNASRLARAERYGLTGFHSTLYASEVAYQYLGLVVPTVKYGSFGVGLFRLGVSDIEHRDADNLLLGSVDDSRLGINLAYGTTVSGYDVGVVLTMEHHSLGDYSATSSPGLNLSVGRQFVTGSEVFPRLSLGVTGRNVIQPSYKLTTQSIDYPQSATGGVTFGFVPTHRWGHQGTISASLTKIDGAEIRFAAGVEYSLEKLLHLRGGVREGKLSFGVGLSYRNIDFDYALVDRDLGSLHMFSLGSAFGTPISEKRRLEAQQREEQFNDLMRERLVTRNRNMVAELVTDGQGLLDNGDLIKAESNFDRALFLARANAFDTLAIYELVVQTEARLKEVERLHRLNQFLDSAMTRYEAGEYLAARYYATQALKEDPGSPQARKVLASSNQKLDALASRDKLVDYQLAVIDSLLGYGRIQEAISASNSLEEFAPDYPRVTAAGRRVALEKWKGAATTAFGNGNYHATIANLDSALVLFPDHKWCLDLRAQAQKRSVRTTEIAAAKPAAETEPLSEELKREVDGAYQSAQQSFEQGNLPEAIVFWEKVERLAPDYLSVREYLINAYKFVGVELYSQNQMPEAVGMWKKAIALAPDNDEIQSYIERTETEIRKLRELSYEQ